MNSTLTILLMLELTEVVSLLGLLLTMVAGFAILFYRLGIIMQRFVTLENRLSTLEEFIFSRFPVVESRLDRLEFAVARLSADCEPVLKAFPVLIQRVTEISFRVSELTQRVDLLTQRVDVLSSRLNDIVPKVDVMWASFLATRCSPIVLNEEGQRLLNYLGPNFIDPVLYQEILLTMKALSPENRYQVQQHLVTLVGRLANREGYQQFLENAAFDSGSTVQMLLYAVAINIRDRVLSDLNFNTKLLTPNTPS